MGGEQNSEVDHHGEADQQLLDSLLQQILSPEPEASDARIHRVLERLDEAHDEIPRDVVTPTARATSTTKRRPWTVIALAVSLLLALLWQSNSPSRQAYATIARSLERASDAGSREYRVVSLLRRPLKGMTEIEATLFVNGNQQFALQHPAVFPFRELWIGGNEREKWIVPTRGPILVGNDQMLQNWISDQAELSTPYLHITTILRRMSENYELVMLPDEDIASVDETVPAARCRRVQGIRRGASDGSPRIIDLWADRKTGAARQLVLSWQLTSEQFGRSQISFQLVGYPDLPDDWFEHAAHHAKLRPVISLKP